MSDVKVYEGAIPQGGFDSMQNNAGFDVSKESESGYVPGGPATAPKIVKDGGVTEPKTYDHKASASFIDDASYNTVVPEGFQARSAFDLPMKIVNPDDLSHEDHC